MKLRSLELNQFKKFTAPTRLDGIDGGLNVVVGPNEMGKSTLLDALRAALFEKYSSKARPITALQNVRNQAGPTVALTFELDGGRYRITKRFIKKAYARLSCPDGRLLEGDLAEDTLRNLLGFDEAGKSGAKPETLGMWHVLWVQQGQSFGMLDLPEKARANLHNALESEVGAVLGGRRGRALPRVIEKQIGTYVTQAGKPRAEYKKRLDELDSLRNDLEDLKFRRQELARTLADLEQAQDTLARLSANDRDQADQKERDQARERHSQLAELEARIEAAQSDLKLRQRDLEQAEQARQDRSALKETIATEESEARTTREHRDAIREREAQARAQRDEWRVKVRTAEIATTKADDEVSRQHRVLAAVTRQAQMCALQQQCQKARAAEKRRGEAQQGAAAIRATAEAMAAIHPAAKALERIKSRLDAAATRILFDMAPEGLTGLEIDGAAVPADRPFYQAVEPATIKIPDRGQITIEPAIKDRDQLLAQLREAKNKLKNALESAGTANVNDAEEQYAQRQRLLQDAELARQEAELHAPATAEYEAGAQALADHIEGLRQILAQELDELGLKALPPGREAETALQQAREQAAKARAEQETTRAALAGPEDTLGRLQTELGAVEGRYADIQQRLEKMQRQLRGAEDARPDHELDAAIAVARAGVAEQEEAVAELAARRTDETLPQLKARIDRLEKALHDRRDKREALKVTISGLKSRIEAAEGAGLDEAIAQKTRELALAEEECQRLAREVQVLTLLLTTLRAAEQDAKARYLSPVLSRVRPYLQLLFPGAEITIDENLRITGVVREAGYEEAFHHLSMGTQEQIAVLVRLAFAEMLVEQGHPATVILDDALVFSDDRRMSRMFDILNMAAHNVQLVIFTCREQLFEELGGNLLALQTVDSEEVVSV